jgi:hypothetical protein
MKSGGPLGMLLPVRRIRFEESIATNLSRVAPVLAINPPGKRLAPLGAARETLNKDDDSPDDEAWKTKIEGLASNARAVVVGATPRSVRKGFAWELETVSGLRHGRVILVVGPHKDAAQRWEGFLGAVAPLEIFAPLTQAQIPTGVHVLAHQPGQGWRGFGAESRTDWSYAFSFEAALEWMENDPDVVRVFPRPVGWLVRLLERRLR